MATVSVGEYTLRLLEGESAPRFAELRGRAALVEEHGVFDDDHGVCFLSVSRGLEFPFLEIVQRYSPSGGGFSVGVLLIPESHRLFVGAGTRLLAYDLIQPGRLWNDEVACGFWFWSRHGSVVFMGAELELSAWDPLGNRLWTIPVEPPWTHSVSGDIVSVDIMGTVSSLDLRTGRPV